MSKRETFKDLEVQGKRWRVGKFDALTGSYIAYKLLFQMLPMGMEGQMEGVELPAGRATMSKAEFIDLQKDCLSVCSELTYVGSQEVAIPIMNQSGRWLVEGLENDTMLVMMLTIHSLVFNVSGFFQEGTLQELTTSFQGLNLFSAPA